MRYRNALPGVIVGLGVVLATPTLVSAQAPLVGTARNAIGTLIVVRPDGIEVPLQGRGALQLFESDVLRTATGSRALIEFGEGIQVALNENTAVLLTSRWEKVRGTTRILRLAKGEIWVKVSDSSRAVEVETPVAAAAVRETEFTMKVGDNGDSAFTVIRGTGEFASAFGACQLRGPAVSRAVRGKACTAPTTTETRSTVAWSRALFQ